MGLLLPLLVLVVAAAALVARGVVVVKADERALLERLGKRHAVLSTGTHLTLPFVDAVVRRFPPVLQASGTQMCATADSHVVELRCTVDCAVVDVMAAHYITDDVMRVVLAVGLTTLRARLRDVDSAALDGVIASGALADAVTDEIGKDAGGWGIEVTGVVVAAVEAAVVVPVLGAAMGESVDGLAASALPIAVPAMAARPKR